MPAALKVANKIALAQLSVYFWFSKQIIRQFACFFQHRVYKYSAWSVFAQSRSHPILGPAQAGPLFL